MQTKLRKLLAVLACLMLVCTMLPLSTLVVSAETGVIANADFESGSAGSLPSNWKA